MGKVEVKRHFQDVAHNWAGRVLGGIVVDHCAQCPRFMIWSCRDTGRKIRAPRTGPIDEHYTLPESRRDGRP